MLRLISATRKTWQNWGRPILKLKLFVQMNTRVLLLPFHHLKFSKDVPDCNRVSVVHPSHRCFVFPKKTTTKIRATQLNLKIGNTLQNPSCPSFSFSLRGKNENSGGLGYNLKGSYLERRRPSAAGFDWKASKIYVQALIFYWKTSHLKSPEFSFLKRVLFWKVKDICDFYDQRESK